MDAKAVILLNNLNINSQHSSGLSRIIKSCCVRRESLVLTKSSTDIKCSGPCQKHSVWWWETNKQIWEMTIFYSFRYMWRVAGSFLNFLFYSGRLAVPFNKFPNHAASWMLLWGYGATIVVRNSYSQWTPAVIGVRTHAGSQVQRCTTELSWAKSQIETRIRLIVLLTTHQMGNIALRILQYFITSSDKSTENTKIYEDNSRYACDKKQ